MTLVLDHLATNSAIFLAGSTLLLLVGVIGAVVLRSPAHSQRVAELAVTAALVWLVLAVIPLPRWRWQTPEVTPLATQAKDADIELPRLADQLAVLEAMDRTAVETGLQPLPTLSIEGVPTPSAAASLHWPTVQPSFLAGAYLVGGALAVGWLMIGWSGLLLLSRRCRNADDWVAELFRELAGTARDRPTQLRIATAEDRPLTYGVWRPVIVLPSDLCQPISRDTLRHVLLHELTHVRRRDAAGNLLLNLALPVLYLHPLYWWLRRRARWSAELVADDCAARLGGKENYARNLIALARRRWRPVGRLGLVGLFQSPTFLERRIEMLLERTSPLADGPTRPWRVVSTIVFLVAVFGLAGTAGAPAAYGQASIDKKFAALKEERDELALQVEKLRYELAVLRKSLEAMKVESSAANRKWQVERGQAQSQFDRASEAEKFAVLAARNQAAAQAVQANQALAEQQVARAAQANEAAMREKLQAERNNALLDYEKLMATQHLAQADVAKQKAILADLLAKEKRSQQAEPSGSNRKPVADPNQAATSTYQSALAQFAGAQQTKSVPVPRNMSAAPAMGAPSGDLDLLRLADAVIDSSTKLRLAKIQFSSVEQRRKGNLVTDADVDMAAVNLEAAERKSAIVRDLIEMRMQQLMSALKSAQIRHASGVDGSSEETILRLETELKFLRSLSQR